VELPLRTNSCSGATTDSNSCPHTRSHSTDPHNNKNKFHINGANIVDTPSSDLTRILKKLRCICTTRTFFPTSFSSELAVRVCVCAQHSTILNKKRNPRAPKHVPDNDVWNNVKLQLNILIQYCTVRSRYFVNHPPATRTRIQATRSRTPNNPLLHAHVCLSVQPQMLP
jgi:hypothetical protein